jgi:hypothetical protein
MHIDYDEARTSEERGTYHSSIHVPLEALQDVRPLARLMAWLRRR